MEEVVARLTSLAERALGLRPDQREEFLALADEYLSSFSKWQDSWASPEKILGPEASEAQREKLRGMVGHLTDLHEKLLERAEAGQAAVGDDLSDFSRRGQALKRYSEASRGRVSITGLRRG